MHCGHVHAVSASSPAPAQLFQNVAYRQVLVDGVAGKRLAAQADRGSVSFQNACGQPNVLGYDQIVGSDWFGDDVIGRVCTAGNLQRTHLRHRGHFS
ncbi:hypothetical protein PD5205_02504 [Xanthomonas fragariae]|uniref:Uncharacterized protein n=1 Tax=Xanthomonas fragariae TaxID=48664 RepID=A0A1Y6H0Q4_9XANT|nr:hypothetical protein NBC2815_02502 [Xanthomonas fragariae]SMQ99773.1 hypothetical protein PD885_02541 [Xanthomonas fragariae]SMR03795.1 hypothetical protein PD5205_02504 [Xanthomonas fragariae]